jgi:hypothetical protein
MKASEIDTQATTNNNKMATTQIIMEQMEIK